MKGPSMSEQDRRTLFWRTVAGIAAVSTVLVLVFNSVLTEARLLHAADVENLTKITAVEGRVTFTEQRLMEAVERNNEVNKAIMVEISKLREWLRDHTK